jgi:4-aminobutyrate aminotransferase-like enzyme
MKNIPLPPTNHKPKKYSGPSADEVLALRKQFMNPAIFLYYKKPLMVVEGSMQYVWDDTGKRYLDGLGGIVTISVGHCHPHVIAAGNRQSEIYQHSTTIYLHPNVAQYDAKPANSPRKLSPSAPASIRLTLAASNAACVIRELKMLRALPKRRASPRRSCAKEWTRDGEIQIP